MIKNEYPHIRLYDSNQVVGVYDFFSPLEALAVAYFGSISLGELFSEIISDGDVLKNCLLFPEEMVKHYPELSFFYEGREIVVWSESGCLFSCPLTSNIVPPLGTQAYRNLCINCENMIAGIYKYACKLDEGRECLPEFPFIGGCDSHINQCADIDARNFYKYGGWY